MEAPPPNGVPPTPAPKGPPSDEGAPKAGCVEAIIPVPPKGDDEAPPKGLEGAGVVPGNVADACPNGLAPNDWRPLPKGLFMFVDWLAPVPKPGDESELPNGLAAAAEPNAEPVPELGERPPNNEPEPVWAWVPNRPPPQQLLPEEAAPQKLWPKRPPPS